MARNKELQVKVGDLVRSRSRKGVKNPPVGVIVNNFAHNKGLGCTNKRFKVLWHNGTIGDYVWDFELETVSESR